LKVLSPDFSQGVDAGVDADPTDPGRKKGAFIRAVFGEGLVGFDERFLKNILRVRRVFKILIGQGKDFLFMVVEERPERFGVALPGQPDQCPFVHSGFTIT
jgi:hypothetical protein